MLKSLGLLMKHTIVVQQLMRMGLDWPVAPALSVSNRLVAVELELGLELVLKPLHFAFISRRTIQMGPSRHQVFRARSMLGWLAAVAVIRRH